LQIDYIQFLIIEAGGIAREAARLAHKNARFPEMASGHRGIGYTQQKYAVAV
jgi:hypothetical protein